jgi:hypothetical protein
VTYDQLLHAIRAASDVSGDDELIIFGSQAILGSFPDAPESLRASIEVDVQPLNRPEAVDDIDGALGELSMFHTTHGFYVHGVSLESTTFPRGWMRRTVTVTDRMGTRGARGRCVEVHDLAVSKLVAFRDKDRDFVRVMIAERLVESTLLIERLRMTALEATRRAGLIRWVEALAAELGDGGD